MKRGVHKLRLERKKMSSQIAVSDNLEVIKGISPSARRWLGDTFNVYTFSALANLSVEDLVNQIKAEKKPTIWLRWAKNWPAEAAIKATEIELEPNDSESVQFSHEQKTEGRKVKPGMKSPTLEPDNLEIGNNGWETLALYFIEYQSRKISENSNELQTKVVFEGPGQQLEEVFLGIEQQRAFQWIIEHAEGIFQFIPEIEKYPVYRTKEQDIESDFITISRFNLSQLDGVGHPRVSFSSKVPRLIMVTANQPFDIEVVLEGFRQKASKADWINFSVQFNVMNLDTNDYKFLGKIEPKMVKDRLTYSAVLPNISLERGKYRLNVLVLTHPKLELLDSIEIPFLNVY